MEAAVRAQLDLGENDVLTEEELQNIRSCISGERALLGRGRSFFNKTVTE